MGPVTPLLAVMRAMKKRRADLEFIWAGTPDGPERAVVEKEGIKFFPITVAKFPRYPSIEWIKWPANYLRAQAEAKKIINAEKPDLVASAGGFTSVPIMSFANKQKIPCVTHQLDAEPGLSNIIVAKASRLVTTTFEYDVPAFAGVKTERVPTPSRFANAIIPDKSKSASIFGLNPNRPIVFFTGGGTGALALNDAIATELDEYLKVTQVIHLTGLGKLNNLKAKPGYFVAEFFDEQMMLNAFTVADLVVSRAGIGSIADLACLSKPAVFIPIPQSHQERNVKKLPSAVVQQGKHFSIRLRDQVLSLIQNKEAIERLGPQLYEAMPTDDGSALAERWLNLKT